MYRYLLSLLLLCSVAAYGGKKQGQALVDSLKNVLKNERVDTARVKLYIDMSNAVSLSQPADGLKYAQEALKLAEEANWKKGQARAHIAMGVNLNQLSALGDALASYADAMKLYEELHNEIGVAQSCWGIGNVYNVQKNYRKALEYQARALHIYEKTGDKMSASYMLGNMANNYMLLNQLDTALGYYKRSLAYHVESGNTHGEAIDMMNVGAVYFKKNDLDAAIHAFSATLQKIDSATDKVLYARSISNLGSCLLQSAIKSLPVKADSIVPATPPGRLARGMDLIQTGTRLSIETGDVEQLSHCYNDLYEGYKFMGDYKTALEHYELARTYRDSIFSEENNTKTAEVESKLKLDLKEKDVQIARLRSQVYVICIAVLLAIIAVVVFKFIRQARSNKLLANEKARHVQYINAQKKILERIAYLQSHDLRGSVTNILGFLQLYNKAHPEDPANKELIEGITTSAQKLDNSITEVVKEENKLMKDIKNEAGIQ